MELISRPFRADDAAALAVFFNELDAAFGGPALQTGSDMRAWMAELHDVERDSRVLTTPDGVIVAAGAVSPPPPDGVRGALFGGVAVSARERGIGRDLIAWQVRRLAELRDEVAPGSAWTAQAAAMIGDASALRLYRRSGFAVERYWYTMLATLVPAPPPRLPDGIEVRPYAPGFREALYAAHMEAFADHFAHHDEPIGQWAAHGVESPDFRADLSRVAFDGDEIAGLVHAFTAPEPGEIYIGVVGTRPAWRERGLALALLKGVLADAATAGLSRASLTVDAASPTGAVGLYERAGFAIAAQSVSYRVRLDA